MLINPLRLVLEENLSLAAFSAKNSNEKSGNSEKTDGNFYRCS